MKIIQVYAPVGTYKPNPSDGLRTKENIRWNVKIERVHDYRRWIREKEKFCAENDFKGIFLYDIYPYHAALLNPATLIETECSFLYIRYDYIRDIWQPKITKYSTVIEQLESKLIDLNYDVITTDQFLTVDGKEFDYNSLAKSYGHLAFFHFAPENAVDRLIEIIRERLDKK